MNKRIEMLTQKYPQLEVVAKDVDAATAKKIADAILGLERNWEGDPAENPHINTFEGSVL